MHLPLVIFALLILTTQGKAAPEQKIVDGVTYHVVTTSPKNVIILWKDDNGKQLNTFSAATAYLKSKNLKVETIMNGGIFEPKFIPSGLLIQDGEELNKINRQNGKGNFFLKPNGILIISKNRAAIIDSAKFPPADAITSAVQSGPLLLNAGKTHPAFNAPSASRLHRNGVGIKKNGDLVFAITDFTSKKFPNLFEFAELFRSLGCQDALFLDGDLSQMVSGEEITQRSNHFASMIAIVGHPK